MNHMKKEDDETCVMQFSAVCNNKGYPLMK